MQARHPEAIDGVGGQVPDAVTLGGETLAVDDDGTLACTRQQARELAGLYGVDYERVAVDKGTDSGPTDGGESDTCEVVKADGDVCGRERPCPYHDD